MLIIEGSQEGRVQGVRVLSHCVFCLTEVSNPPQNVTVKRGTVRKYVRRISHVQVVESELKKKTMKTTVSVTEFPTPDLNRVWREVVQRNNGAPLTFPRTPPICQPCGLMLQKIHEALKDLDVFVNTFTKEMKCCGIEGINAEEKFYTFLRRLRDAHVDDSSRRMTLNFLEKLGHGGLTEDEYQNFFPKETQAVRVPKPPVSVQVDSPALVNLEPGSIEPLEDLDNDPDVEMKDPLLLELDPLEAPATTPPAPRSGIQIEEEITAPKPPPTTSRPSSRRRSKNATTWLTHTPCDVCKSEVLKKQLRDHVRSHVGDYILSCPNPECHFACAGLPRFIKHLRRYKNCSTFQTTNPCQCSVCDSKFTNTRALSLHMNTLHGHGPKEIPCPFPDCLTKLTNRQSVQIHISNVHVIKLHSGPLHAPASLQKCPECAKNIDQCRMKSHLETFHKIPLEALVPCKYCPYVFCKHDQLLDHLKVHTTTGSAIACHMCHDDQKYLRVAFLRDHYFKEHQIGTSFVCEHCTQHFFTVESLKSHVTRVHSDNPAPRNPSKKFKCDDCIDDKMYTKKRLVSHKITHHGAEPLSCQSCEETFSSMEALWEHGKKHKGVVRPRFKYACDIPGCEKRFNTPRQLKNHKMSVEHLGRTDAFICALCGKGYNTDESLKQHVKNVHAAVRKFICEECGESFKSGHVLKKHKRIHTGERPFECPFCKQRFRTKEVLKTHVDSHKRKGAEFKPNGPMAKIRKRVNPK